MAGSFEEFGGGRRLRGGGCSWGSSDARPRTTGSHRGRAADRRPWSSSPIADTKSIAVRMNNVARSEEGGKEQCGQDSRQRQQQIPAKRRPKTAGAGSGGVQGVIARMGGYEKVIVTGGGRCGPYSGV